MPPEDYLYDVFISYPRRGETSKWVEDHFFPALYHCLSLELDREPKIYFDKMLEQGSTWPIELGNNLASSRILLSLWTRNYLNSEWCSLELAHMLAREKENRLRTMDNPKGIISLPIIHDGDTIPTFLNKIQKIEIKRLFNPHMRKDSQKSEDLYDELMNIGESLAIQIENAPQFKKAWRIDGIKRFMELFDKNIPTKKNVRPRFTAP